MEEKFKIAVFIDFDNIEIGVKSTLQREFDVAAVLDALKERGEIVTKIAYANWGRQDTFTRQLSEHAVQMVQRDPSPRGDKNGADINLALDALEMAFTHDHINSFAIVSGDSDFIALVNKLKQYDKRVFVVGGRAFTSTILQKNCHEFISYESLLMDAPRHARSGGPPSQGQTQPQSAPPQRGGQRRPPPLELSLAMPLVDRALQVLERREVRPQLGLLKSTMLQLDSTFSEKAYGAGSFTDFVEKLQKADLVNVTGGEGRYMIMRKGGTAAEPSSAAKPEEALPVLRDVLETHRLEIDNGALAEDLAIWVKEEQPDFDWKKFGFQEFSEMLNFAQDKGVVRVEPDEEKGLLVYLGREFHPPAVPEPEPEAISDEQPTEEPQPLIMGKPASELAKAARRPRRKAAAAGAGGASRRQSRPRKTGGGRRPRLPQPDVQPAE
ncbi:MAG: NYN domain-containing protein [Acidobacteriia bacterium]|nr:NYN domain-containing protein [Terriglobia bacterium]